MSERKLALAIQKPTGKTNLGEETVALLNAGGLTFNLPSRVDDGSTNIKDLEVVLMRNGDITRALAEGEADLGVVGLDKYGEYPGIVPPLRLRDLGFSLCRLKLGVREGVPYYDVPDLAGRTIATSYPVGSSRFFENLGVNVNIRKYDGGAETAVKRGVAQACIEVSDTGYSMRVNGIVPVKDILESQAILVANPNLPEELQLVAWKTLRAVMTGLWKTQYKLLKFDFPLDKEAEIMGVVPSRESPTRSPLEKPGWAAAETLMPISRQEAVIDEILRLGARAVFVNPIERLVPDLDDPEVTRMMRVIYGDQWNISNIGYQVH